MKRRGRALKRRYGHSRKRRIFQGMKYMVEARTPSGWKAIYSASSMAKASKDAARWSREVGQETRIVSGPDHPSRRG